MRQVVAGNPAAWQRFVESHLGFLHALAWRYARGDQDLAEELCLVALEGLRRPDAEGRGCYRLRRFLESREQLGTRSRFTTWLALVAKNLFRDWFREREGRRHLPREIEGLAPLGQEVFRALFWQGLTEAEAWGQLHTHRPGLGPAEFEAAVAAVYGALRARDLWTIYQDLLRRLPAVSLDAPLGGPDGPHLQLADPDPVHRPDARLLRAEEHAEAERLRSLLAEGLASLPAATRQVVQLLVFRGLDGDQVRRVMGFRTRQRVYDEMARARRRLRTWLGRRGLGAEALEAALADLGACAEPREGPGSRSGGGGRLDGNVGRDGSGGPGSESEGGDA